MPFSGKNFQVCSLSTIMREFTAMHSVASLPFKDSILSAAEKHKDGDDQSRAWNVPQPLMDHLKANLNDSQLEAVNVSILCDFLVLFIYLLYLISVLKAAALIYFYTVSRLVFRADLLFLFRFVMFSLLPFDLHC
jgi:hypothetical protein